MLGRDIPLLPDQWSNEGQQHELHGVREPARAGVYKNKRLELPKPHGCKRVIRGVRFHGNLLAAAAPAGSISKVMEQGIRHQITCWLQKLRTDELILMTSRSPEQEELGVREGGSRSQPSRPCRGGESGYRSSTAGYRRTPRRAAGEWSARLRVYSAALVWGWMDDDGG